MFHNNKTQQANKARSLKTMARNTCFAIFQLQNGVSSKAPAPWPFSHRTHTKTRKIAASKKQFASLGYSSLPSEFYWEIGEIECGFRPNP